VSVSGLSLTSGSRWSRADLAHNGVRALSLIVSLVAFAILVGRGEVQMLPIAVAGLALGPAIIMLLFKGPERRYLLTLFFSAFAIRLIAAVIAHPYLITTTKTKDGIVTAWTGFLFEDDRAYHKVAYSLLEYWTGKEGGVEKSEEYLLRLYTYMVAWLYLYVRWVTPGDLLALSKPAAGAIAVMAPKLMNCFIGAIAIVPMFALGRELGGDRAGRLVALAGAFWPSMILWSVLNLKDILVVALIASIMFFAIRFARNPGVGAWASRQPGGEWLLSAKVGIGALALVGLLVSFALTENLRLYVFYAFGWLVPITFFLVNRAPWRRRLVAGFALWAAVLVVMLGMNQGTQWLGLRYLTDKRQEALDTSRGFGAGVAESGIELSDRLSRYEGGWAIQMRNIPIVMPYVLWAPFPWAGTRLRDLAVLPEALAWYAVQVLSVITLVVYGRSRWRELFLPVVFIGGLVFVFSIIEGNVGTIYRHRVMLFPAAFPLAAMGALWVWSRWRSRGTAPGTVPSPTPDAGSARGSAPELMSVSSRRAVGGAGLRGEAR
jgi:hypothetical protein